MPDLVEALNAGLERFGADPFAAHERWEDAWRGTPGGPEEALLQGLIQLAAAEVKRRAGNARGVEKNREKALRSLSAIDPSRGAVLGLDVPRLLSELQGGAAPTLPARIERRGILYLHGFASGPSSAKAQRFASALGAVPLRIPDLNLSPPSPDAPGGRFDFFHLSLSRALQSARRHLFEETIVVGSSLGGYLGALLAGASEQRVRALVLMAPAFDFAGRFAQRFSGQQTEVEHYATKQVERLGPELLEDARRYPAFPPLPVVTEIFHGERDDTVPVELSRQAAARAPNGVELHLVDDDHALMATVDRVIEAARRRWAARD